MRRTGVLLLLTVLISACGAPPHAPVSERRITSTPGYHQVQKGETVYSIAWMYGQDYKNLARWNGIPRPYAIYPKQMLALKPGLRKLSEFRPSRKHRPAKGNRKAPQKKITSKVVKKPQYRHKPKTASRTKQNTTSTSTRITNQRVKTWLWPTKGKVIRKFSRQDSGKKGIAIAGVAGQRILAAASGKVVYSGAGLLRYGKLIIIKHNNTYLSAYAHNRRILVKEGSFVKQGQKIAEMGKSGTGRVTLHFEIRKNGKPVNPVYFLSKR